MKDRIIAGYLKDFCDANDLGGVEETKAFEFFINYCVVSREHPENFEFENVSIGGSGDYAIDGIAILVNDHIVNSKEEIDFFKKNHRRLDVRFLFIQSKTSEKFDQGDIGNFLFGIRRFFSKDPLAAPNVQIARLRTLVEYIYDSSIDMDRAPSCEIYYAATGIWACDPILVERIEAERISLLATSLFFDIVFRALDADAIKTLYRDLRRKVTREIVFEKHTILPTISDVEEAYIGILPCEEYIRLVTDNEGKLQRSLFYDNVRDYQGNNPVNLEIEEALKSGTYRDKFVLLNNGITIVANSISKIGSKFSLRDFQIVNGCQTSHVLFRNQEFLKNAFVPIKIIVTRDQEVASSITKGTNRQTEVKIEAFESLNPFQKELEEFYATFGKDKNPRLYYERRSRQYDSLPIPVSQIISIPAQVKCFTAMFLNEPHSTHRYYGELIDSNRNRLFLSSHSSFPYFLSGYALSLLTGLFSKGLIDTELRRYRYHILFLFRLLYQDSKLPFMNDKRKMDAYCANLLKHLDSETGAKNVFMNCAERLRGVLAVTSSSTREADRLKVFTGELASAVESLGGSAAATVERKRGVVKCFSDIKGFGFITLGGGSDVFVHYRNIEGNGFRTLAQGQEVEFLVIETERGLAAEGVRLVDVRTC